ncbi:MAG: amidophosphoribosyltransferase [Deltaproteobacteria bacterium]|nr:amidophosphoribosyltransferase [Deltaproteobacteria bacterium]
MDSLKEECGIVAIYHFGNGRGSNVSSGVVRALLDMQNRGQLSAGLTSYNPQRNRILQTHKDLGTVHEVFRLHNPRKSRALMEEYGGLAAIGHNRYATSGDNDDHNAQPFERVHGRKWKWFAIAFNGNLANYDQLKKELEDHGYHITYHSDTEVMMHYFNHEMRGDDRPDFNTLFSNLANFFDGSFNIAFLNAEGDLVVIRDPLGIKPLCYSYVDETLIVASESVVMHNLNIDISDIHMVKPGEMIIANQEGFRIERYAKDRGSRYCFFEWVYFANLSSSMEGRSVYQVRSDIGRELAMMEKERDTVGSLVASVPETATTAAAAFGYHMGLPVVSGLLRNRYVGRTFIDGVTRSESIRMKFTPLQEILQGRRVYLVDDSLVRGTTLKTVISILKERGKASEVHVRIGCPPVMGPCFYGIDMPTVKELFAPHFMKGEENFNQAGGPVPPDILKRMEQELGADSLGYLSLEGLVKAVGLPREDLCLACLDNNYPTPAGEERFRESLLEMPD